jgi:hypothetical protein
MVSSASARAAMQGEVDHVRESNGYWCLTLRKGNGLAAHTDLPSEMDDERLRAQRELQMVSHLAPIHTDPS